MLPSPQVCGALGCEDFERGVPENVRTDSERAAAFDIATATVHSGNGAGHFETHADQSWSALVFDIPSVQSGSIYVRFYAYLPAGSISGRMNVLTLENEEDFNVDVNFLYQDAELFLETYSHQSLSRQLSVPGVFPTDEWFCVNIRLDVDDEQGGIDVAVASQVVLSTQRSADTLPGEGITQVGVGIMWTESGQEDGELFVDDIQLDTARTACP